jgi:hypothetical protein
MNFTEGEINFAPSYKLMKDSDKYSIKRTQSWTDRIMFRSNNNILHLMNYESNNLVKVSDHRPVFAQFILKFNTYDKQNFRMV